MKKTSLGRLPILTLTGLGLSAVTALVYALFYGMVQRSMDSMSWSAFWLLVAGVAVGAAMILIKQRLWTPIVMAVCHFIAFLFFIYGMYPYISAAMVGIDSTWEVEFFVVAALFLVGLVVNVIAACLSLTCKSALVRSAVPVTAFLFGVLFLGNIIAMENAPQINGFLNISSFVTETEGEAGDTDYFPSRYTSLEPLMADGRELAERAMAEGAVLLKNENSALPLTSSERSVTLFGIGSVDPVYGGTGSGAVDTASAPTLRTAMERNGLFTVNPTLWDWYSSDEQAQYKRVMGDTGPGVKGVKVIGEAPWSAVSAAAGTSLAQYGDAAVVVISRVGGEGSDMPRGSRSLSTLDDVNGTQGDTTDGDYLKLSPKEINLLKGVKAEKDKGTIKKIVVLLNFANQVEAAFLDDDQYGIDAALWIGTPGQTGLYAVAEILAGNVNPSGRLSSTFWRTHDQNPALANFGATAYEGAPNAVNSDGSPQQDKYYVIYQEGIYLGYKYAETRYEDTVMGAANVGSFDYGKAISYPFGYGLSYSTFEYSNFQVTKSGEGADTQYTVRVTVTNAGSSAGKEVVQVYLQKPYGDYNRQNGVEAASVELVGFDKTAELAPGSSETLEIVVDGRQFASYDAHGAKTYVLTDGDYYLTAAKDSHAAVNNILAKKGYTTSSSGKMDADGDAAMVSDAISCALDTSIYSTSAATGYPITNQFSYADWNQYANNGGSDIAYMTRSDWAGTTPKNWDDTTVLPWNDNITADQDALGRQGETKLPTVDGDYPAFETYSRGKGNFISLIELRADENGNPRPYDDPLWDELLDQLSWSDIAELIPTGMRRNGQIAFMNKPEALDHNGPSGLTEGYSANPRGLATTTNDPLKESKAACYPCGGILAATYNLDLMYEIGDLIGEDALWAGYNGLYGPGSNIQRTPYSGRNFEYYSEDGYLSGIICAYECAGMESHGLYVYNKHIGLNDQEDLRRGICTWAGEQAIREIYMRAFELPITIDGMQYDWNGETVTFKGASSVMLAFNRMGLHWSGMQKGLCTEFLRNECGMTGIIVTDMWYGTASTYMNLPALLIAGGNLVDGRMPATDLDASKPGSGHADVAWAMRESMHRILYTVVHSNTMNGISPNTKVIQVTPWWQTLLTALIVVSGVLTVAAVIWTVLSCRKEKKIAGKGIQPTAEKKGE